MPAPLFPAPALRLLRRPAAAASLASCALAGSLLTALPLFEVPGWELASAMGLLLAIAGAVAGFCAARLERASLPASLPRAVLAAALPCLLALAVPFLVAVLHALLGTRCSPWMGAPFYLVLPVPGLALACTVGALLGFSIDKAWKASLAWLALLLLTLAVTLWPLWDGPQVFALNHLLGYFPGPLYDESLPVEPRLLWYRGLTLAWTALLLLLGAGLLEPATGRLGRRFASGPGALAGIGVALLAIALGWAFDFELGLRTRESDLERALGGRAETAHLVLHYPRGKSAEAVQRLERDAEFDYQQVAAFLGAAPAGKIHAWFHESAEQKRARVGAAHTNFAKPWRLELHVHDEAFPHPVLRHELAHDVAAAFGAAPFAVSARLGVAVNIGLVEGLAVAAEADTDELTAHQWAAAMRRLKLAPDLRAIVGPAGFYRQAAARSYTLSGSFLRWLREGLGAERLRRLYRDGDFEAAYGRSLDSLAGEWEAFLDALPLDERALHTAQVHFERGSVFDRPCAREVARLKGEADSLRREDPPRALSLYQRCAAIEPGNPAWLRAQAELFADRREWTQAQAAWERLLALQPAPAPGAQARALMGLGDALWWQGQAAAAGDAFARALALHRDRGTDRTAFVKLQALGDAAAGAAMRRYFEEPELPAILGLQELAQAQPGNATARYLVGRQLLQHGDPSGGARWLGEALSLGLGEPELTREAGRQLVEARYLAGDCPGVVEASAGLASSPDETDRAFAREWQERCAFEARTFGGPLVPQR